MEPTIRRGTTKDSVACAKVIYEAFKAFSDRVGTQPEFSALDPTIEFAKASMQDPSIFAIVAEIGSDIVGCNFLTTSDDVACVGPIAVATNHQKKGIARLLLETVIIEGYQQKKKIQLTAVSSNLASTSLYLKFGFRIVQPLIAFSGKFQGSHKNNDVLITPMTVADIEDCDQLHRNIVQVSRLQNIKQGVVEGYPEENSVPPLVARSKHTNQILGFCTGFFLDGIFLANHETVAQALIVHASSIDTCPPSAVKFHVMSLLNPGLITWALENQFRIAELSNLMSITPYNQPSGGAYLPSVSY